jgi:hypothetical protein
MNAPGPSRSRIIDVPWSCFETSTPPPGARLGQFRPPLAFAREVERQFSHGPQGLIHPAGSVAARGRQREIERVVHDPAHDAREAQSLVRRRIAREQEEMARPRAAHDPQRFVQGEVVDQRVHELHEGRLRFDVRELRMGLLQQQGGPLWERAQGPAQTLVERAVVERYEQPWGCRAAARLQQ